MKVKSKVLGVIMVAILVVMQVQFVAAADNSAADPNAILQFTEDYSTWGFWEAEASTDPQHPEMGQVIKTNAGRGGWVFYKNLKPNTRYIVTADVRVEGEIKNDVALEAIDFLNGNDGDHTDRVKVVADSNDYKTLSVEFTTGDCTELNITCWNYGEAIGYYDNIKLVEAPNLLDIPADPDAILQFTEDYSTWGFWEAEASTDPQHPERGQVIKANAGRGGWVFYKNLKPNTKYVVTADVRVEGEIKDDVALEAIDFLNGNDGDHTDRVKAAADSNDYKTLSVEFTTGDCTELNITCWNYGEATGYYDNIILKEVAVESESASTESSGTDETVTEAANDSSSDSATEETANEDTATAPNPKTGDSGLLMYVLFAGIAAGCAVVLKRKVFAK